MLTRAGAGGCANAHDVEVEVDFLPGNDAIKEAQLLGEDKAIGHHGLIEGEV